MAAERVSQAERGPATQSARPSGRSVSRELPRARRRTPLLGLSLTPTELERTALLFCLLFLASAILVIGRTARDALFLTKFPVTWIAPMWMAYGAASSLVALGYARVADRLPRVRFVVAFAVFAAVSYAALRVLIGQEVRAAYSIFYVWSEIIANLTAVVAWTVVQDLHDTRSAKRLFGLIGAGRVVGTVVCGFAAGAVVGLIGTANLMLVLVAALLAFAGLTVVIARRHPLPKPAATGHDAPDATRRMPVWRSRYVLSLVVVTLLLFTVLTIGDYQFKAIARTSYPERDDLARFMGNFYGAVGAFGLVVQIFVTPRLLQRWGVSAGMLAMPALFTVSTAALLGLPSLAFASVLKASDNGLQFTIHDATMQLLYFPFPTALRDRVRTLVSAIVKPIGYGLGAIALVVLAPGADGAHPGPELVQTAARLGLYTLPIALVTIGLMRVVRDGYVDAMKRTLIRREIDPEDMVATPSTLAVLEEALHSTDSPQVLFAVDRLRSLEPDLVRDSLPKLVAHRSPRVRALALRLGCELAAPNGAQLASRALGDPDATVRIAAVEALAFHLREDAHDDLLTLADQADDEAVRTAAIAALLRSCGLDGMLDGAPRLRALLESGRAEDRVAAARALGMVGEASLQRALARLLADVDPDVRRAAIQSASTVRDPRLLPMLVEALAERAMASAAARAIAALGNSAIPELASGLADPTAPRPLRAAIPRVLLRLETHEALAVLLGRLDEPDEIVRQKILASASRLRRALGAPPVPLAEVRARIDREIVEHERTRDEYTAVRPVCARPLLDEHVLLRLRKGIVRVLRLCELAYPREAVASARAHLFGSDATLRANAFEVLESLVDRALRERLVDLVERYLRLHAGEWPHPSLEPREAYAAMWIRDELRHDPYRAAVALDAVAYRRILAAGVDALAALRDPDPFVRETAAIAVAATQPPGATAALARCLDDPDPVVAEYARYWTRTGRDGLDPNDEMYTTIEKVLFLQRIPVFSHVAGDDLVGLARGAVVETMHKGDVVFREGDPGGVLYFVVSGAVTLSVKGREVAYLAANEVFGEMSIFDRELRNVTATIAEDAELLRVLADDFHDAVRETVEVAEAVIRVLNRRLREADRRIAAAEARAAAARPGSPLPARPGSLAPSAVAHPGETPPAGPVSAPPSARRSRWDSDSPPPPPPVEDDLE
jgi:ATP/ADP translocase/HEAT repeat protein